MQDNEFQNILNDLLLNEKVNQMKKYRQHYDVSTFEHCYNVAFINYKICKKLNLDYVAATRAGMLHDLFLYDWREKRPHDRWSDLHAFKHPKIALENAKQVCKLTTKEEDIILKHMWPVTLKLPQYKESYIITIADKYSAILEGIRYYSKKQAIIKAYILSIKISKTVNQLAYVI